MAILKTLLFYAVIDVVLCYDPHKVLASISESLGTGVLQCKKKVNFHDEIITEFLKYWEPFHQLQKIEMGCVVFCVVLELELMEFNGTVRLDNVQVFMKANGADDETMQALVDAYKACSMPIEIENFCENWFNITTCFRKKIFQLHWEPNIKVADDNVVVTDYRDTGNDTVY